MNYKIINYRFYSVKFDIVESPCYNLEGTNTRVNVMGQNKDLFLIWIMILALCGYCYALKSKIDSADAEIQHLRIKLLQLEKKWAEKMEEKR